MVQKVKIRKSNGQCSVNINKDLIEATGWQNDDMIVVSKIRGESNIVIENITRGRMMKKLKELEKENKDLMRTIEILKDKNLIKNLGKAYKEFKEGKGHTEKEVFGHLD